MVPGNIRFINSPITVSGAALMPVCTADTCTTVFRGDTIQ
jgi:hypothetical protein